MAIAGFGGAVKINDGTTFVKVAEVNLFSLEISRELIDTTSFDTDGWKTNIPSFAEWSGSLEANWNIETQTGQDLLEQALLNGLEVQLELYTDEAGNRGYRGTAFIAGESIDTPVDDKVTVSFEFTGTGKLERIPRQP